MNSLFSSGLFGPQEVVVPLLGSVFVLVVTTALVVVASDYYHGWKRRRFLGGITLMDDESYFSPRLRLWRSSFNYLEGFARGYKEYSKKGKLWAVPLPGGTGDMIVLPPHCGKEYYNLPKDHMSMRHMMGDEINFNHVLDVAWKVPVEAMQACNRLKKLDPLIMKEADRGIAQYVGESKSWRESSIFETALDILGDIGVLLVFRPGFGREAGLSKKMQRYVGEVEQMTHLYAEYPRILAPLIWQFSKECRQIRSSMKSMKKTILPEVNRLIEEKRKSEPTSEDYFYTSSMVELALKKGPLSRTKTGKDDDHHIDMMADETMFMFFETVEPSVMILSALLVRMLRHPEYVEPIRKEITEALKLNNGEWSFDMFNHTPQFESFTRETLRLDGIALVAGSRQVVGKPLTIHSLGMTFAPGTNITMSGQFTHLDPEFYPNPTKFDGNRFYSPGSSTTASDIIRDTISPSDRWMVFGIGISACPARLLGTRLCQVVAAKILMAYDMEFGHEGKLPDFNIHIDAVAAPNPEIRMRYKYRQ
ncbi:uncharacterized protein GIQ15_01730 [Arthroderma uncinatum]|uniref:uncharacterized protein n=1 Tax=Arthroderma uncinatum TaxID=74035 RepID=UPI00144AE0E3|nr:uncharacterized protein GIQ15_01730 [Arthroderma uncinatum]KAF3492213.1 hypothetical protein GIQ15_01730 [Arthroderma uncinatum]